MPGSRGLTCGLDGGESDALIDLFLVPRPDPGAEASAGPSLLVTPSGPRPMAGTHTPRRDAAPANAHTGGRPDVHTLGPSVHASGPSTDHDAPPGANGHAGRAGAGKPVWLDGATTSVEEVGLPSLTNLAVGLRATSLRCPLVRGVEFALDQEGSPHLLTWIGDGPDEPAMAAGRLLIAAAWVREQEELLLHATAGVMRPGGPVTQHAFTTQAGTARALMATPIRVHLAVARRSADGLTWTAALLSAGARGGRVDR